MSIAAQINLYSPEETQAAAAVEDLRQVLEKYGIEAEPGAFSTFISGDDASIFAALQEAFDKVTDQGQVTMVSTFSEVTQKDFVTCRAIGRAETAQNGAEVRVILDSEFVDSALQVEAGEAVSVIFYLHARGEEEEGNIAGLKGPNPLGVATASVVGFAEGVLTLESDEISAGALVLDIKKA